MKEKRTINGRKGLITVAALVLLLCAAVGGTLAWLTTQTDPVVNTFTPATVRADITEGVQGKTKESVIITNTGDIPAYIRAAVVINWVDDDGNVCASVPDEATYTLSVQSGWVEGGNYYYYTQPVAANGSAPNLLTATEGDTVPTGYHLQVTILAEAIQSTPDTAIEEAWGVDPSTWASVTDS